jgi:hypothetical protein
VQLSDNQLLRDTAIGGRHESAVMFRNVIPGNETQKIPRDIRGPVGTRQRFRTEKTGLAAADRNFLCRATHITVRSAYGRSPDIETGHLTDSMEQSFLTS